jgi:RNA polymerase sigma factor (sigma-70 family)
MGLRDNQLDEEALWKGVQNGNQADFESLYNEFFRSLYSYGRKICNNNTILEDAIHDLFLDLWRYHANLAPTTSIRFYLYRALRRRIVKNEIKDSADAVFDFKAHGFLVERNFSHEENIIRSETGDERAKMLKKHLKDLPPRQYESLILRFYDDFSYEEIGNLLGVNEQSARNLVQRGLQQLRSLAKILVFILSLNCTNILGFLKGLINSGL